MDTVCAAALGRAAKRQACWWHFCGVRAISRLSIALSGSAEAASFFCCSRSGEV